MDKVLKVFVVLLLIVSAVALAFEIKLFLQRGELKGRNQLLGRYVTQIAKTIEVPPEGTNDLAATDFPRMQVTEEQLKPFYQRDAAGNIVKDSSGNKLTSGPNTMDMVLKDIVTRADLQYSRLNDTRSGLTQTRNVLTETKDTLTKTEGELTQTKDTLKTTSDNLDVAKQDIETKKTQLEELTAKNEACEAKSEKQAAEVGKLTDKLSDRESQLEATKRYVERLQKELAVCQGGGDTNLPPPGLQGQIVFVNTNWNFVVVDVMPQAKVIPLTDLTVQRNDKLVGKVRVSEVLADRNFAVGEILPDWAQFAPEKGDYVFY
jgi:hypothetical protein